VFLFIFESIGTSELILVGIVALIFLGPRKLPQMARKLGKIMSEFRGTANEFKETWAREVNFEEEAKLLNIKDIEAATVSRAGAETTTEPADPTINEIDPSVLEDLKASAEKGTESATEAPDVPEASDKKNWL
jgi:Tat protein translocase TatB subunit